MEKIVLIGGGGHCKVIIDIIKSTKKYEIIGITEKNAGKEKVLDVPVIGDDAILKELSSNGIQYAFISLGAISNRNLRNILYKKAKDIGFKFPVLRHKLSVISPFIEVEEGTCIMAGAIINPGSKVGKNSVINTGAVIEHDCCIGNNVQISPRATLAGNVQISDNTFIGMGSNIIQGVSIGKNVIIGAGSVVINDIPDNSVAVGTPARIIKKKENDNEF